MARRRTGGGGNTPSRVRARLLPVVMFLAAMIFTVKVGDMWTGAGDRIGRVAVGTVLAQQEPGSGAGTKDSDSGAAGDTEPDAADGAAGEAMTDEAEPEPDPLLDTAPELSRAELDVLQQLRERREALDARDRDLAMRESLIKAAERNVEGRIEEWKSLKAEVESLLARYEKVRNDELDTLTTYYEKMKPKDAARVFNALELPYLIDIVGRMKEAKVADIIGKMDTLQAKELTMELARRQEPGSLADGSAAR